MWRNKSPRAEPVRVLVRHADAGLRSDWHGVDEWRGLTDAGHRQATALAGILADLPVVRILSSPSLRCRQTVVPLALACGLDIEPCWQLAARVDAEVMLGLISDPETASSVLCTHRETLQALFERLAGPPYHIAASTMSEPMEKAAVWVVHGAVGGARPLRAEYLGSGAALLAGRAAVAATAAGPGRALEEGPDGC